MKASVCNLDAAGGVIRPLGNLGVTVGGLPWAVAGDPVDSHGSDAHAAAVMTSIVGVTIDGVPVVVETTPATCGHTATGSGPDVS